MNELVIRLRRFKDRKSLDRVASRMLDKAAAVGSQEELKVIAAICQSASKNDQGSASKIDQG